MPASSLFATIIQAIVSLIILAAWVVFFYYLIRKWRRRKTEPGSIIPPTVYGAWQGHNLGTTTMEPGDLPRIERELDRATGNATHTNGHHPPHSRHPGLDPREGSGHSDS